MIGPAQMLGKSAEDIIRAIKEDFVLPGETRVFGVRRWNHEPSSISIDMTQDRCALSALMRDVINALGARQCRMIGVSVASQACMRKIDHIFMFGFLGYVVTAEKPLIDISAGLNAWSAMILPQT